MEYKAERASVPTREVLERLKYASIELGMAIENIEIAWANGDDKTKEYLVMPLGYARMSGNKINEILTCGGRIYDEFSEFLKKEKNLDKS